MADVFMLFIDTLAYWLFLYSIEIYCYTRAF